MWTRQDKAMAGEGNTSMSESSLCDDEGDIDRSSTCDDDEGDSDRSGKAREPLPGGPIVVAMKGHRCTGKTTLARELAASLLVLGYQCSLLSYDDVQSSINESLGSSSEDFGIGEDLPFQILLRVASRQLSTVLKSAPAFTVLRGIVLDLPLSFREHLNGASELLAEIKSDDRRTPFFVVVECRPSDETKWREWSEGHASLSWEDIQKEISEYKDYSMDGVPHLVVDTTDTSKSAKDHAVDVISWISSYYQNPQIDSLRNLTIEDAGSSQQTSWRHFSHLHSLLLYSDFVPESTYEETTTICALCREILSGSVYGCAECGFYLHKFCAELPVKMSFGGQDFVLEQMRRGEIVMPGECLMCYGSSGILYSCEQYRLQIHPKCAKLPRKVRHSCHEHFLELMLIGPVYLCRACGTFVNAAGYYCKGCNVYIHISCTLHLEASKLHERHWEPLVLCTIPRDDTGEYYCEICAGERNPDLWAYYCSPCEYEAHLSCVNPHIPPCDSNLLEPEIWDKEIRNEKIFSWEWPNHFSDGRNPLLPEISLSKRAWKSVDDQEESDAETEADLEPK